MAKENKQKRKKRRSKATDRPLWQWVLIFFLPLVLSELMFARAGRMASMIIFPIVWIGFWVAVMYNTGWPIFKKR